MKQFTLVPGAQNVFTEMRNKFWRIGKDRELPVGSCKGMEEWDNHIVAFYLRVKKSKRGRDRQTYRELPLSSACLLLKCLQWPLVGTKARSQQINWNLLHGWQGSPAGGIITACRRQLESGAEPGLKSKNSSIGCLWPKWCLSKYARCLPWSTTYLQGSLEFS